MTDEEFRQLVMEQSEMYGEDGELVPTPERAAYLAATGDSVPRQFIWYGEELFQYVPAE